MLWRVCAFAQARISIRCSPMQRVPKSRALAHTQPEKVVQDVLTDIVRFGTISLSFLKLLNIGNCSHHHEIKVSINTFFHEYSP